ncbi:MAG: pyruvate kinase [Oryzomonas sp.]
MARIRRTKIIATLGPSSSEPKIIEKLLKNGVDCFRLNFSHGSHEQKAQLIERVRAAAHRLGCEVGILADLQGPKIRTGRMEGDGLQLKRGQVVTLTTAPGVIGSGSLIPTIYQQLPGDVRPGSVILLDDGLLEFRVMATDPVAGLVTARVVAGGLLKDNKGINLPGVNVSAPSLTAKDLVDLEFILKADIDFIALSFVRCARDLVELKLRIAESGRILPVIAKIEKPEAIHAIHEIVAEADGVMVARGDLGVELKAERVPILQKRIIAACNQAGKPVITATQMLDSMIRNPRPTRAETSDIANAIIDGTDAVMLSGETASGDYPVQAVATMAHVALEAEASGFARPHSMPAPHRQRLAQAVAAAACQAADTLKAKAIVAFTKAGGTAQLLSSHRPVTPIICFASDQKVRQRLALHWGVRCLPAGVMANTDQQIDEVERLLHLHGFKRDDLVVITMGTPVEVHGTTNLMKIHNLGTRD